MKKITLGIMAVVMAFSAMAQTTENSSDKNNSKHKEFKNKQFKGGENFDKLNLTDAQKAQVKTINESFRQQMQDLHKQGSITVDEQKQKREALVKEHKEKISAILTPEQRQQAEAFKKEFKGSRKNGERGERFGDLAKDLNLTPEQSAKMSSINSTFRTNLQSIRQNSSLSKDEKREQMKSLMKQHRSDMEALLTNDQKEQMKSHLKNRPDRTPVK
ncbi:MAG: hypothetical protein JWQ09_299 [Segetibacter sp.]|nr:hypothetical protein [Segetibacter sp.]